MYLKFLRGLFFFVENFRELLVSSKRACQRLVAQIKIRDDNSMTSPFCNDYYRNPSKYDRVIISIRRLNILKVIPFYFVRTATFAFFF